MFSVAERYFFFSFAKEESPIDILVGRLKIFSFTRLAPPLPGPIAYWDPKKRILLSFFYSFVAMIIVMVF